MCGIVDALSFKESAFAVTEPYIIKMRDTMVLRGPDGAAVYVSIQEHLSELSSIAGNHNPR